MHFHARIKVISHLSLAVAFAFTSLGVATAIRQHLAVERRIDGQEVRVYAFKFIFCCFSSGLQSALRQFADVIEKLKSPKEEQNKTLPNTVLNFSEDLKFI